MASDTYGAILLTTANDVGAMLQKKMATPSETYAPAVWAKTINLLGKLPEASVSGSIAHLEDGADAVPLKSWLVNLPASLDGYASIVGNKGGANFAELSNDSNPNKNAFTYTTLTPAKIEWEKTLSGDRFIVRFVIHIPKAGNYTFSEKNNAGGLYIYSNELWGTAVVSNKPTPYTHTFPSAGTYVIGFYNSSAIGTTGTLEEIACYYGLTADAFSVYTAPTTYTAQLGRTVYGGTADIVTGEGEDENGNAFTFTPITPTPETVLGVNNCWSDEGDTTVTYRRDIDLALQALSGSRGLMMARPPAAAETEETEPEDETTETIEETPEDMEK